jgi:hypothetical protein
MRRLLLSRSPSGLLAAFWMVDGENVTIRAERAPMWKFILDPAEDPGLDAWREIAAAFPDAGGQDLRWLAETIASVETWGEEMPYAAQDYDDDIAGPH